MFNKKIQTSCLWYSTWLYRCFGRGELRWSSRERSRSRTSTYFFHATSSSTPTYLPTKTTLRCSSDFCPLYFSNTLVIYPILSVIYLFATNVKSMIHDFDVSCRFYWYSKHITKVVALVTHTHTHKTLKWNSSDVHFNLSLLSVCIHFTSKVYCKEIWFPPYFIVANFPLLPIDCRKNAAYQWLVSSFIQPSIRWHIRYLP